MKAIMVMFDTLNRHWLPAYGGDAASLPNFARLAQRTVVFDNCYVGSMPCMPARRELHTGRSNFLHRSWGPLEPFDDSMPELLKLHGVHTHLVTDHQHYWEDGGGTYHNRYSTYEFVRGQEGDAWIGQVRDPYVPDRLGRRMPDPIVRQDWINRSQIRREADFPQLRTFAGGLDFIRRNGREDNWFLQLETFDPHEPFHAPERFRGRYARPPGNLPFDWPRYGQVTESPEEVARLRTEYAALLAMCDESLGRVLDLMDELGLWRDTMLIVNTDHGFLLGEHDEWAKCVQPFYNEVAHVPLFVWDPRCGACGERRSGLVQIADMAPTLLELFGAPVPSDMQGRSLRGTIARDEPVRTHALFGIHGGHVNITDGRYVYMHGPADDSNGPLFNYTLMPTHMRRRFEPEELRYARLVNGFSFTKGCPVLQVPGTGATGPHKSETLLFDLARDPRQLSPLLDAGIEKELQRHIVRLMREQEAPEEQYARLGFSGGEALQ